MLVVQRGRVFVQPDDAGVRQFLIDLPDGIEVGEMDIELGAPGTEGVFRREMSGYARRCRRTQTADLVSRLATASLLEMRQQQGWIELQPCCGGSDSPIHAARSTGASSASAARPLGIARTLKPSIHRSVGSAGGLCQ